MEKRYWNSIWFKVAIILIPIALYIFVDPMQIAVKRAIFILSMVDVDAAKGYILSFGIWAPIVSFLLMILQSLLAPLPAFIITFANAGLFGWVKGAILSWSSAMVGAALCYAIARIYGRTVVEKFTTRAALKEVDKFFERYGKWAVLVARLLPFVSFDIVSYAAGLTAMGFWEFFWATGLGQLPATIIYSYVGGMLTGGARTMVRGLSILFALTIVIFVSKQAWQARRKATVDESPII
ncbi:MAG: TVP38/TMEM64 family protein [Firmicutes bacterium HGW-Firmicutes-15]|nr:MAG: TVP38/TMEM64 family protein [Firmicutes bacterium HGW-Firmicutes-15]